MRRWLHVCSVSVTMALASIGGAQPPQPSRPPASQPAAVLPASQPAVPAKLEELAFLEGHWRGELKSGRMEEYFSSIDAGMIMGMFRMIDHRGQIQVVELELFRQVGDHIEYRFRHFSGELNAWEAPKEPLALRLVEKSDNRWVWMDADPQHPRPTQPHKVIWTIQGVDRINFEVIALRDGQPKTIINSAITRVSNAQQNAAREGGA